MKSSVLDTNVLLRFLVGDERAQHERAAQWFREAEAGTRRIAVTPVVIAETSFVLESFYRQSREHIAGALEVFVSQRWLQIDERIVLQRLWPVYRKGLHFVDAYLASWATTHGCGILTFDKVLKKREGGATK